ncbi:MAG: hypothetical protein RL220_1982 [Bacteroidota bacterium]
MKRITALVSNDIEFDQRVRKVCTTLSDMGFEVHIAGRYMKGSRPFASPFHIHRFHLLFQKGAWFYAALNIRLFFFLLFHRTDVILANDLDTLFPAYLVARIRRIPLVYDSHEYFTGAEALTNRPFIRGVWERIEKFIVPKLKHMYTVNESIAEIYRNQYGIPVSVVRNVPGLSEPVSASRSDLGLPENKAVIILQGAYIDPDRGAAEAVEAMRYVEDAILLIIGAGREMERLKSMAASPDLSAKVHILGKMPFQELRRYTSCADLALSLDKPVHLNYMYSLPNKLFDYIHAGVPVLLSRLPELERIMNEGEIGMFIDNHDPKHIAGKISEALLSPQRSQWKANMKVAAQRHNWQHEETVLRRMYKGFLK